MSDTQTIDREGLIAKAKIYGMKFPKNISTEKLLAKIEDYEEKIVDASQEKKAKSAGFAAGLDPVVDDEGNIVAVPPVPPEGAMEADMINVYIRLTNLNSEERDIPTAFVAVGSAGKEGENEEGFYVARYIPFGKPWPVPLVLVRELQRKKMQIHEKVVDKDNGKVTVMRPRQVPHYAVEILDPTIAAQEGINIE